MNTIHRMSESDPRPECPGNFQQIITDFTSDLTTVFPEYAILWQKWSSDNLAKLSVPEVQLEMSYLFEYCTTVFPERFFDILYQNVDIFNPVTGLATDTCFLPNVEFKLLYNTKGVSDTTQKTMWRYLQLILFTIVGAIQDKSKFGNSLNMFDGIDETELHAKLNDTIGSISDFFQSVNLNPQENEKKETGQEDPTDEVLSDSDESSKSDTDADAKTPKASKKMSGSSFFDNMPKPDEIHNHLKGLFDGKIGNLAKEMAEDISKDLSGLFETDGIQMNSTQDVIKALMKDPKKITGLIKSVGDKLNSKISSGEISQEELMREAGDLMGKMKGMAGQGTGGDNPLAGMGDFMEMFKNFGKMAGMGKAKVDTNALTRMTQTNSTKERMRNKMMVRKAEALHKQQQTITNSANTMVTPQIADAQTNYSLVQTDKPDNYVFRLDDDDVQETSTKPVAGTNKKKKKKVKK